MALQELPVNTHLPNRRPSASSKPSLEEPAGELDDSQRLRDSIPPSSIQSMLRLTTETGDVGEFSIRPSRVPRSVTKSSFHRSDSVTSSFSHQSRVVSPRPQRHHHRPEPRQHEPPLVHQSMPSASGIGPRQSHFRGHSQVSAKNLRDLDRQTSQLPQPPLIHHQSVSSLRTQQSRPRSPYAYPTRLKRPGYRSPSPSVSDLPNGNYQPKSSSIRAPSPASTYSQRRYPPGYHAGLNQSSTLLRTPSPALPPGHTGYIPTTHISRAGTPLSHGLATPFVSCVSTPAREHSPSVSISSAPAPAIRQGASGPPSLRSPSPAPLYYDYTESFYEVDIPRLQGATSKLSLPVPSASRPIPEKDLATPTTSTDTEEPAKQTGQPKKSPGQTLISASRIPVPQRRYKLPVGLTQPVSTSMPPRLPGFSSSGTMKDDKVPAKQPNSEKEPSPAITEETEKILPVNISPRSSSSYHLSLLSSSLRKKRDLKTLSSNVDSISSGDLGEPLDRDSGQRLSTVVAGAPDATNETGSNSSSWKLPNLNFNRLTLSSSADSTCERIRSSKNGFSSEYSDILAPTPERPASSQSHHHRFSKILSIDETFPEMPETLTVIEASDASSNQNRSINGTDGYVHTLRKRECFHFPRPPMRGLKAVNSLPTIRQHRSKSPIISSNNTGKSHSLIIEDASSSGSKEKTTFEPKNTETQSDIEVRRGENLDQSLANTKDTTPIGQSQPLPHQQIPSLKGKESELDLSPSLQLIQALPAVPDSDDERSIRGIVATERPLSNLERMFRNTIYTDHAQRLSRTRSSSLMGTQHVPEQPGDNSLQKFVLKLRSGRDSAASPPASRPWNMDESYPWMENIPQVLETPPDSSVNTHDSKKEDKLNSLTAKIKRRFSSPRDTSRMMKRLSISSEVSCMGGSTRELAESPKPPVLPEISEIMGNPANPMNSARVSIQANRVSATNSVSLPPSLLGHRLPVSPQPIAETRSFFSDDSSQMPHQSLRKRISNLKGRRPINKASFARDQSGVVQPSTLLGSYGRQRSKSLTDNEGPVAISNIEYPRRRLIDRLKAWWQAHIHFRGAKK